MLKPAISHFAVGDRSKSNDNVWLTVRYWKEIPFSVVMQVIGVESLIKYE